MRQRREERGREYVRRGGVNDGRDGGEMACPKSSGMKDSQTQTDFGLDMQGYDDAYSQLYTDDSGDWNFGKWDSYRPEGDASYSGNGDLGWVARFASWLPWPRL